MQIEGGTVFIVVGDELEDRIPMADIMVTKLRVSTLQEVNETLSKDITLATKRALCRMVPPSATDELHMREKLLLFRAIKEFKWPKDQFGSRRTIVLENDDSFLALVVDRCTAVDHRNNRRFFKRNIVSEAVNHIAWKNYFIKELNEHVNVVITRIVEDAVHHWNVIIESNVHIIEPEFPSKIVKI